MRPLRIVTIRPDTELAGNAFAGFLHRSLRDEYISAGRAAALARFLDYILGHDRVWIAKRLDIARHWLATHPPHGLTPSRMSPVST